MCIMEVRPGQRTSTILQAFTHNLKTIESDIEMLQPLLRARGEVEICDDLDAAYTKMEDLYQHLLRIFADALKADVAKHGDSADPHAHHHERPANDIPGLVHGPHMKGTDRQILAEAGLLNDEAAALAAVRAERYETR